METSSDRRAVRGGGCAAPGAALRLDHPGQVFPRGEGVQQGSAAVPTVQGKLVGAGMEVR